MLLLLGALRAKNLVALKMNVPGVNAWIQGSRPLLPALNSPTVSPLRDSGLAFVETVVQTTLARMRLREAGAVSYYIRPKIDIG